MTTEEHVIDEELVEVAMQIILRAGEARTEIKHALKHIELKLTLYKGKLVEKKEHIHFYLHMLKILL